MLQAPFLCLPLCSSVDGGLHEIAIIYCTRLYHCWFDRYSSTTSCHSMTHCLMLLVCYFEHLPMVVLLLMFFIMLLREYLPPVNVNFINLIFIDSIFQDYCWWRFLVCFTLLWQWIMVLWFNLLLRRWGRYLAMVMVFLIQWEVVST